ncbi:hypothetical protein GCM10022626_22560 [[Pseudomonas] carboxydohydrogena]
MRRMEEKRLKPWFPISRRVSWAGFIKEAGAGRVKPRYPPEKASEISGEKGVTNAKRSAIDNRL